MIWGFEREEMSFGQIESAHASHLYRLPRDLRRDTNGASFCNDHPFKTGDAEMSLRSTLSLSDGWQRELGGGAVVGGVVGAVISGPVGLGIGVVLGLAASGSLSLLPDGRHGDKVKGTEPTDKQSPEPKPRP